MRPKMNEGHHRLYQTRRYSSWIILLLQTTLIAFFIPAVYPYVLLFSKPQLIWSSAITSIVNKFVVPTATQNTTSEGRGSEAEGKLCDYLPSEKQKFSNDKSVQFIIERFDRENAYMFNEVSNLCITVFFQEKAELDRNISPSSLSRNSYSQAKDALNSLILSFPLRSLKDLQQKDLSMRKQNLSEDESNEMLIARQVFPCSATDNFSKRTSKGFVFSNETKIYNPNSNIVAEDINYILGDIIGFAEVTSKTFALGEGSDFTDTGRLKQRPVLSNFCVKREVRGSGVGSALLGACEKVVTTWIPSYDEIVLLVEEDNAKAIQFYERRGYEAIFSDPTSRRYEATGFFVKNVRSTKICMRKKLSTHSTKANVKSGNDKFNLIRFLTQAASGVVSAKQS